jgi:hypothetical protein
LVDRLTAITRRGAREVKDLLNSAEQHAWSGAERIRCAQIPRYRFTIRDSGPLLGVIMPTKGFCQGMGAWRISQGNYGDVKLNGLGVGFAAHWPKAIHEGGGTACLFFDERADPLRGVAAGVGVASMVTAYFLTSAKPSGKRVLVPLKMTSSILPPRRDLALCSPSTQAMASDILLFPHPFGPTIAATPIPSKTTSVLSANDLKP